jgi:hypothetical protein
MNEREIIVPIEHDRRATRPAQMTDTPVLDGSRVAVLQGALVTDLHLRGRHVVLAALRLNTTVVTPRIHCTVDLTARRTVAEKSHLSLEDVHLHQLREKVMTIMNGLRDWLP